ncbi:MAG: hypothetical protein K5660_09545 [Paludibacteraceae bacterium]|nr:hypothetical protein [Paludibacteraceae bacterium]
MKEGKQTSNKRQKDKQELHIHIERWQDVVNILDDKKRVFLFAFIIIIIGLALFWGISIIIVQLKNSYTYSDITTNALGATQLRDEEKEISYFLFNTAELWANSGIQVKKGDIISVHASGRGNTAIHHLYDNAKNNKQSTDEFFGANGERVNPENDRNKLRSEYRIFPKLPQSALVMQVVNTDSKRKDIPLVPRDGDPNNFYYIGAHCENIHINNDGWLYFAINDIVLDSATIVKMMLDNFVRILELEQEKNKKSLYQEIPISKMRDQLFRATASKFIVFDHI